MATAIHVHCLPMKGVLLDTGSMSSTLISCLATSFPLILNYLFVKQFTRYHLYCLSVCFHGVRKRVSLGKESTALFCVVFIWSRRFMLRSQ